MAETSAIQWTDGTVNFWWGCTKVGPGCDHCYAEDLNMLRGTGQWGVGAPRRKIKGAIALIRKLQREADKFEAAHGRRRRIFMHSMSDVFDNEVDAAWTIEALAEAEAADRLDIQIVTKRVSNVEKMVPSHWRDGQWPRHIGLMITVTDQREADRDVPRLLNLKRRLGVPWVGLSMEPLLGSVDLRNIEADGETIIDALAGFARRGDEAWDCEPLDWVIVGGESGRHARPMDPDWARDLRNQCFRVGVPFFFKQWGEWAPGGNTAEAHHPVDDGHGMWRFGKKAAGRLLDGVEHNDMPEAIDG